MELLHVIATAMHLGQQCSKRHIQAQMRQWLTASADLCCPFGALDICECPTSNAASPCYQIKLIRD